MSSDADTPVLYHIAPSRSSTVLWMLEEVGAPYALRVLDMKAGEQRQPAYLAVNPMGKVPALVHRGVTVTEAGAVCAYLADAFPEAGLAPAPGDPLRGAYFRWLFFNPGCLEPAMTDRALQRPAGPTSMLGYGDYDTTMDVLAAAVAAGPFLLGERFSAADVLIGSGIRWGLIADLVPKRPEFVAYAERLGARPAAQRAAARDAELMAGQGA